MRKFINKPDAFVDETLEGILLAHPDDLACAGGNLRCIVRAGGTKKGKVALATGGGSGHLPVFLGYVGEGMLDGCSVGGVFQSPSADTMYEVTKAIDAGAGVCCIFGNYSGDRMNFDMAAEMAGMDDIRVEQVIVADDVASAPKGSENKRRGVAGLFFVWKIAGACADSMASLDEVKRVALKVSANVRTMVSPCPLARYPRRVNPPSPSARARWKSAWASTASRASGAALSKRLMTWSPKCSGRCWRTCPTHGAMRSRYS